MKEFWIGHHTLILKPARCVPFLGDQFSARLLPYFVDQGQFIRSKGEQAPGCGAGPCTRRQFPVFKKTSAIDHTTDKIVFLITSFRTSSFVPQG